jgi:hypothetical protein
MQLRNPLVLHAALASRQGRCCAVHRLSRRIPCARAAAAVVVRTLHRRVARGVPGVRALDCVHMHVAISVRVSSHVRHGGGARKNGHGHHTHHAHEPQRNRPCVRTDASRQVCAPF